MQISINTTTRFLTINIIITGCTIQITDGAPEKSVLRRFGEWKSAKTCHIFLAQYKKKSFLHRIVYMRRKIGFILRILSAKIMGRPRRTIHIDRETESLWYKEDVLCLVKSEERCLE